MPNQELLPRRDLYTMFPGKVRQDDQFPSHSHSCGLRTGSRVDTPIEVLTEAWPADGIVGSLDEIGAYQRRTLFGESAHANAA